MKTKTTTKSRTVALPANVRDTDTKRGWDWRDLRHLSRKLMALGLSEHDANNLSSLTFYKTDRFGWVLTTLGIRNAGRSATNNTARSYGVSIDTESVVTVGHGPHVTANVTVYLTSKNVARLATYVKLWLKGLSEASSIRDRISTRRAQGALRRSMYGW